MRILAAFISTFLSLVLPAKALSDIIVHDIVVPIGKEVMLRAEVKGRFFSKGGEIVEFFVNGKSIGKSLSGMGGFAFRQFIPPKTGIYQIKARAGKDEGKGLLLSLRRGSRIVFVDVEGSLFERFSNKPRHGSQKVMKDLHRRFPVVLLQTGLLNIKSIKAWLKKNGFPELPVVTWRNGVVFSEFNEKGFKIKAVIGSQDVIDSAKEYKPLALSFEETEDAVEVRDWEEIRKKLK
ncbi:MAG: hypothetical protein QMC83_00670 [Thermodesulfovibrionales bacterium]|nr:hypothetical protein [Thermodesulfovibrionales bacterium]